MQTVIKKEETTALVGQVASKLRREILSDQYQEGDRIPSFRKLAKVHGVSIFTVHRALAELKKEGLVITREGASTLVGKSESTLNATAGSLTGAAGHSVPAAQAVRWMRRNSSLRKLRISILEKTFASATPGPRFVWRDEWKNIPATEFEHEVFRAFLNEPEPTCAVFNRTHAATLEAYQSLADFSELLDGKNTAHLQAFLRELKPGVLDQAASVHGDHRRVVMLPTSQSLGIVLYSRNHLAEAGLPDRVPQTWDELHRVLAALEKVDGRPPLWTTDRRGFGWLLAQFCQQLTESPGPSQVAKLLDYHAEEIAPALELMSKLLYQKPLMQSASDGEVVFSRVLAGEVPVCLSSSSLGAQIVEFGETDRFLIGPVPTPDGTPRRQLINISGWVVNAHAPVSSQRAAAAQLLAYVSWMHSLAGGAQMRRLAIARSLFSNFADASRDGACQRPLPAAWQEVVEQVEANTLWEPRGSSFEYEAVGDRLLRLQQAGTKDISVPFLRQECRTAQRISSGIDLSANETDAVSLAFS